MGERVTAADVLEGFSREFAAQHARNEAELSGAAGYFTFERWARWSHRRGEAIARGLAKEPPSGCDVVRRK